ncbi:GSK3-beta interaction protein [Anopheles darlingi]|uniref:GSKIP domain-containing protein n=1 Tax=Anopheles darlingi TaxID=43151 RepID=A0A2M4CK82_ANODA|nr:GSK3-beta interaction protein [Anopheles darlingi]
MPNNQGRIEKYHSYCDDDIIDWSTEATAIIEDIAQHIKEATLSKILKPTLSESFMNLTTLEDKRMCIKVSAVGLEVVGDEYDQNEKDRLELKRYETPYALLSDLSPSYINAFGNNLENALKQYLETSSNK